MMTIAVAGGFALAAAGAALFRAAVQHRLNGPWPWGTFGVNVGGSAVLGALHGLGAPAATIVGVAALGSVTTYSGFVAEIVDRWESGRRTGAAGYGAASIGAGIAAAWIGLRLFA